MANGAYLLSLRASRAAWRFDTSRIARIWAKCLLLADASSCGMFDVKISGRECGSVPFVPLVMPHRFSVLGQHFREKTEDCKVIEFSATFPLSPVARIETFGNCWISLETVPQEISHLNKFIHISRS